MKKVFSYLLNITGYILILAFIVISVTENTSYVDKYYKNSIKNYFENTSSLLINFNTVKIKWKGAKPSIILDDISLYDDENILLRSEKLIINLSYSYQSFTNLFRVSEIDIVESELDLIFQDNKFTLNNYDLFNNKSQKNGQSKNIKYRISKSKINIKDLDNTKNYILNNINAVVFNESDSYKLFSTFNHQTDKQVIHLASELSKNKDNLYDGSVYVKAVNIDTGPKFFIDKKFSFEVFSSNMTAWANISDSEVKDINGKMLLNNLRITNNKSQTSQEIQDLSTNFNYKVEGKKKKFIFDNLYVNINDQKYKNNKVSFILNNQKLSSLKIKKISSESVNYLNRFYLSGPKGIQIDNIILGKNGFFEDIIISNLDQFLNLRYHIKYSNLMLSLIDEDYHVSGVTGTIIGNTNKGVSLLTSNDLVVYKEGMLLSKIDSLSGNVNFKRKGKKLKIYSENIEINKTQKIEVNGLVSKTHKRINLKFKGDSSIIKNFEDFQTTLIKNNQDLKADFNLDYTFIQNNAKSKNYGTLTLKNIQYRNEPMKVFLNVQNFKLSFLDRFILSDSFKITLNNDTYNLKVDSNIEDNEYVYSLVALGKLSSDSVKKYIDSDILNSISGASDSILTLKYKKDNDQEKLIGELKTTMVGLSIDLFDPFTKNQEDKKSLQIKHDFFNRNYVDIRYDVYDMRFSQRADYLNINIVSPYFNGSVRIPDGINESSKVYGRLQYVDMDRFKGSADPKSYPPMSVQIKAVKFGERVFNNFNLNTSSHKDGMSIDSVSFANQSLSMNGQGKWVDNETGQMTFFDGNFNSNNFGKSLNNLGYKKLIKKGKLNARMIGQWPNSPESFSLDEFDGKILLNLEDGDFLQITKETRVIGQLLGLFSIASLQKRLSLDFSDFFSSGLSFDQMSGEFNFSNSITSVKSLNLSGTFGEMTIDGVSDIKQRTHNHTLTYIPDLSSMSLISGTLLGGPIGAVASIFYDKVLKQIGIDTNELAAVEYTITGPWDNPEIKLIEPFKQLEN